MCFVLWLAHRYLKKCWGSLIIRQRKVFLHKSVLVTGFLTLFRLLWSALNYCLSLLLIIRRGADKSLARPGRKQATATKLGIYSTYSHEARCSNFCKPLKIKFRRLSVQPGLGGSNDLRVGWKMATFNCFFQSREQWICTYCDTGYLLYLEYKKTHGIQR